MGWVLSPNLNAKTSKQQHNLLVSMCKENEVDNRRKSLIKGIECIRKFEEARRAENLNKSPSKSIVFRVAESLSKTIGCTIS